VREFPGLLSKFIQSIATKIIETAPTGKEREEESKLYPVSNQYFQESFARDNSGLPEYTIQAFKPVENPRGLAQFMIKLIKIKRLDPEYFKKIFPPI
jgi:hypothetical protein